MAVRVALRLRGIDLRGGAGFDRLDDYDRDDVFFESHGALSLATIFVDSGDAVAVATDSARRIAKLVPGVSVPEVFDELVGVAEIADRCEVAAEAVRLWSLGKRRAASPFPAPRQVIASGPGRKSMNLYAWRDVVQWVRAVIKIDPEPDIQFLDDHQIIEINSDLAAESRWTSMRAVPSAKTHPNKEAPESLGAHTRTSPMKGAAGLAAPFTAMGGITLMTTSSTTRTVERVLVGSR